MHQYIRKTAIEAFLLRFFSGATGNRTRDTRIFSPLLYQLSYGTRLLFELPYLSIGIAKVDIIFESANFSATFFDFLINIHERCSNSPLIMHSFEHSTMFSTKFVSSWPRKAHGQEKIHISDIAAQA